MDKQRLSEITNEIFLSHWKMKRAREMVYLYEEKIENINARIHDFISEEMNIKRGTS
jgi:hypothetical protein